jgi:hypothetical protein
VLLKQQSTTEITDSTILTATGRKLSFYSWNLLVLAAIPFSIVKFNENPTFFGIVIGIMILIILPFNYVEYFIAENDKLIVLYKKDFFLSFLNKRKTFNFSEIDKITAVIKINERTYIMDWVSNLTNTIKWSTSNTIDIEMINGKKDSIGTEIVKEDLLPIIDFMKAKGVKIEIVYPNNKNILFD